MAKRRSTPSDDDLADKAWIAAQICIETMGHETFALAVATQLLVALAVLNPDEARWLLCAIQDILNDPPPHVAQVN